MRGKQAIILGILLLILAGVGLVRVWPMLRMTHGAPPAAEGAPAPEVALSRAARLKDGSFNPIPPVKAAFADDPTTLVAALTWRERYQPYLATATSPTAPSFYVYPFLDRTPEGVGVHCTYGWHLTGQAALAQWTDARLAGRGEPVHYGLPTVNESGPDEPPTLGAWIAQALADPAARDARYIVVGAYDYDGPAKAYTLQVKLLDRQAGAAAARDLLTSSSAARGDFNALSAAQRSAARQVADQLVKLGLAHPRPAPAVAGLELDKELGEVARLLDASDSWAVMEGIDRALALANLYPQETLPLQAAAYGLNELRWANFDYLASSNYTVQYALEAYALAQVALAMDPAPALSQMSWAGSCEAFSHTMATRLQGISGQDPSEREPELIGLRNQLLKNQNAKYMDDRAALLPDWQILWHENWQSVYYGKSDRRDYFTERIKYWTTHDLYMMALLQGYRCQYDLADMRSPMARATASRFAAIGLTAAECAALLALEGGGAESDSLINMLADQTPIKREALSPLVKARDYYRLRQALIQAFWSWDTPVGGTHPMYRILTHLEAAAAALMQDPSQTAGLTRFAGIEFTPARRVDLLRQRDDGSVFLITENGGKFQAPTVEFYLKARPSNVAAHFNYNEVLDNQLTTRDVTELKRETLKEAYKLFPIDNVISFRLGRTLYQFDDPQVGERYIKSYLHTDPFNPFRNKDLGEMFRRYGYHARAIKYYGEFLKEVPERYDIANERAWSLCQTGRGNEPEVRQTFARPVSLLPGNNEFHEDNLNYLLYWAQDTSATRAAAKFFRQYKPDSVRPIIWQVNAEQADGKTSAALEILNQAKIDTFEMPKLAEFHISLAEAYLDLNQIDKAEEHFKSAARMGSYPGSLAQTQMRIAFVRGDYDAIQNASQAYLQQLGYDTNVFLWNITALEKKGQRDRAIALLEEKLTADDQKRDPSMALCRRLMRLYAEANRPEPMTGLMDKVAKAPSRTRGDVLGAVENYKKLHAKEAEEIKKNIDRIMAGPEE